MRSPERTLGTTGAATACATIGITATILWCKLMGHSPGFLLASAGLGDWANARVFWLAGILACSLVCLLLPKSLKRLDAVLQYVLPLIGTLGAMAFALSFHQDFFDPRKLAVAGIVASGFGYFWLISRFVLSLALTRGLPCMVWAFAAAFPLRQVVLAVLDATMTHEAQVLLAMALPVVAAIMLGLTRTMVGGRAVTAPEPPASHKISRSEKRHLVIVAFAMALMLSVVRACSISGVWGTDHTIGLHFTSVAFTVAFQVVVLGLFCQFAIVRMARYPIAVRFQLGSVLVMASLVVAALRSSLSWGDSALLDSIVNVNDPMALLLFWSTVACAAGTLDISNNRVVGAAGAAYAIPSIAWVVLITGENAVDSVFVLVAVYLLFIFFMVATLQLRPGSAPNALADRSPEDQSEVPAAAPAPAPEQAPSREEAIAPAGETDMPSGASAGTRETLARAISERCDEVAADYGLSPRERDVLGLLVQGQTSTAIQEELVLAASTVKTHMQHIYGKVGVGDRQQLMEKVFDRNS